MSFLCRRVEYALGKEKAARRVQEEKEVRARWEKCRLARTGRERSTRQMGIMPPGAYRKRKKYAPVEKNAVRRVQEKKKVRARREKCRPARTGKEKSTRPKRKTSHGAYRKKTGYAPEEKNTAWRVQLEKVYNLRKEHVKRKQRKKEQ